MAAKRSKPVQHVRSVEQVEISTLQPYDQNPRIGDISVIADSLKVNGQFKPIVVQRSSHKILAGNHTFMAARKLGWDEIAVVWVDVDDDEARRIVLADNRTSDFGGYDEDILASLLDGIETPEGTGYTLDDIEHLTSHLHRISTEIAAEEDGDDGPGLGFTTAPEDEEEIQWDDLDSESDGIVALRSDVVFLPVYDPLNRYEMPEMLQDGLADLSGKPIDTWVGPDFSPQFDSPDKQWLYMVRVSTTGIPWERAIVGFFTRDYRFESWWEDPARHTQRILNLGVTTVLEPDFTITDEQPYMVALWQVYRQRWLARYFQEAGLMVVPNYGTLFGHESRKEWVLGGFPSEPPTGCFQVQTLQISSDDDYRIVAAAINRTFNEWSCPKSLVVYGGEKAKRLMDRVSFSGEISIVEPYTALRMRLVDERRKETGGAALPRVRAADDQNAGTLAVTSTDE